MVAEVDSLETPENRKSNENNLDNDFNAETARCSDTGSTKSEQASMIVVQGGRRDTSPSSISKDFQPPMPSIVKYPPMVTITPANMIEATSNEPSKRKEPKTVDPSAMKSYPTANAAKPVTATPQSNVKNTATVSNGGDLDTVDKPNGPLVPSQLSSSKSTIVNPSHTLPGAVVQAESLSSTNDVPPLTKSVQAPKRVSFTGSANAQLKIIDGNTQPQTTTGSVNKASNSMQKPKAIPYSAGTSTSTVSTASKPTPGSEPPTTTAQSESSAPTDEMQRVRMPLVGPYGSFIHPTDTSLADARKRLRKALDQTRVLRTAFTERVYEKYKVILRPVPDTVDRIVGKIAADPIGRNSQLLEEIRTVKEEKEVEKKEAQKLAAAGIFNGASSDGKHPTASQVSNAETADQLAYIGAGLNLVILPEDDMQDSGIDLGKYKYRGPTNPETGLRVGGISAAAATAAEAILDRVRRAGILRAERLRRQQMGAGADSSTDQPSSNNSILSRYHLISSTAASSSGVKLLSQATPQIAPKHTKKAAHSKGSAGLHASGKSGRARNQLPVSVGSILSLNPLAEDLNSDRKPSASTYALLSRGVGSKSIQQQWRHPHPESLGGRRSALSSNSRNGEFFGYGAGVDTLGGNRIGLDLPPLPRSSERREKRPLALHSRDKVTSGRAKKAFQSILSQFVSSEAISTSKNEGELDENEKKERTSSDDTKPQLAGSKRNRRATEIGLMHGMQHSAEGEGKNASSIVPRTTEVTGVQSTIPTTARVLTEQPDQDAVEPIVAFSVLQSLGLIHDTPSSHREQSPPVVQRLMQVSAVVGSSISPRMLGPSSKFLALYRKVTSKKRSFTEAFASDFSSSVGHLAQQTTAKVSPSTIAVVPHAVSEAKQEPEVGSNGGNIGQTAGVLAVELEKQIPEDCPVVSIRGGGGEEEYSYASKDEQAKSRSQPAAESESSVPETLKRPRSAPSAPSKGRSSSRPSSSSSAANSFSQNMRTSSSDGIFSALTQNRVNTHGSTGGFGLAAATAAHQGVVNRLHAQAHVHQLHLQAAAMNRLSPAGDLSNFFGAGLHPRQGFAGHADWSTLGTASQPSVNLLPSHSSLAALGINHHQAAMLELSARDRAARALLAREQQASVHAAAVHRQASAMRGGAGVPGLSTQQAAALMSAQASQAGAGMFSASTASRFGQLGVHSAATAAIMSSPAAAALIGQSQLSTAAMSGHLALGQHSVGQHSDSRPSSQHSTSSIKSSKGKRQSSSKGRKQSKEDAATFEAELASSGEAPNGESKETPSSNKRKSSDLVQSDHTEETETDSAPTAKKAAKQPMGEHDERRTQSPSRESSPPQQKPASAPAKVEKQSDTPPDNCATDSSKQTPLPPSEEREDASPVIQDDGPSLSPPATAGMQFFVPPIPPALEPQMASCALDGRIHVAISKLFLPSGELRSVSNTTALLDYIQAVGAAVPIPKALVSNPLKERLNIQSLKTSGNGGHAPSIPREVVVAIVLVWLWVQHKDSFQRAFAKSGRIDVDPECKWLIQAAVDAASRALMLELAEAIQNGGPLASAMLSARSKGGSGSAKPVGGELEKQATASVTVDVRVALIVSEALMTELCIDEEVDSVIPIYEDLVQLLDETRINALKAKCRERVLLAAVVAQRATMSETFAHAYVSSMVRAGEALDHGELFEMVQDEDTSTSTMIPYDIFSDDTGAWEDPCRPADGFNLNLTGEDLVRRAHARGMILKSLKKMQDRNNIKGGTPDSGPYTERAQQQGQSLSDARALQRTPSSSSKRRASFSLSERAVQAGTGSGNATSATQYNPQHISTPLFWDATSIENTPYGQHAHTSRPRALSTSSLTLGKDDVPDSRKKGRGCASSIALSQPVVTENNPLDGSIRRSTEEVDWMDVAKVFLTVDLAGGSTPSRRRSTKSTSPAQHQPRNLPNRNIIAPFCNRIDDSLIVGEESDSEEEDLSDERILKRHKIVLDNMKERLDTFMEGRTTAGQRARQRAQARAAEKTPSD